ncbi:hypothetical protein [Methylobacter sp.]|uniref:hypothetical protein n=1 Tax=Methylobacter sp. TaxID=2051955 RepID=UPI0025F74F8D|nr:hypothetical protein [Methylobacter sp.]
MKTKLLILPVLVCLLSACCHMNSHSLNADLIAHHVALSQHFEDEANEIQIKVDEHKKLLSQFESESYVYGKNAGDLKSQNQEAINLYEKVIAVNRKMAEMLLDVEGLKCKIRGSHRWDRNRSQIKKECYY